MTLSVAVLPAAAPLLENVPIEYPLALIKNDKTDLHVSILADNHPEFIIIYSRVLDINKRLT